MSDDVSSFREQGEARPSQFSSEVGKRLAPVLAKLDMKPKPTQVSRGHKVTKKAAAKRATPARKGASEAASKRRARNATT